MSIVDRAKSILMKPADEWNVISAEPASVGGLFTGYAVPFLAAGFAASTVAVGLLGIGADSFAALGVGAVGLSAALGLALLGFVLSAAMLFIMAFLVNAVSPSFNGKSDLVQSMKLMTYASTPAWVAAIVAPFIPGIGFLFSLAGIAYVVYLIYMGLNRVLGVPQEKVAGFTVVTIIMYIVLSTILTVVIGGMLMAAFFGSAMMGGAMSGA